MELIETIPREYTAVIKAKGCYFAESKILKKREISLLPLNAFEFIHSFDLLQWHENKEKNNK